MIRKLNRRLLRNPSGSIQVDAPVPIFWIKLGGDAVNEVLIASPVVIRPSVIRKT
jgi:hypothetical protein